MTLAETRIHCPYCGEPITLLVDEGDAGSDYTEDCQVCCRPMLVSVHASGDGEPTVFARREDE